MLDYLRIMLNARLAKMDERGASAVEYGLLIAGIAALIVVVVFAFGGVLQEHLLATPARASGQAPPAAPAAADLSTNDTGGGRGPDRSAARLRVRTPRSAAPDDRPERTRDLSRSG